VRHRQMSVVNRIEGAPKKADIHALENYHGFRRPGGASSRKMP
jgi:hypothetical protein